MDSQFVDPSGLRLGGYLATAQGANRDTCAGVRVGALFQKTYGGPGRGGHQPKPTLNRKGAEAVTTFRRLPGHFSA